jgi:hypothetical protein
MTAHTIGTTVLVTLTAVKLAGALALLYVASLLRRLVAPAQPSSSSTLRVFSTQPAVSAGTQVVRL